MFYVELLFVQQIKFYKYTDAKKLLLLPPEIAEIRCLCLCGSFFIHPLWFISHDIPPPIELHENVVPLSRWWSLLFWFFVWILAAFDFGCKFGWNGDASNVSTCSWLFSFGSYKQDDASFSFSVESYVGFGCHHHCRRRKYCPNRLFCKKSVK